MRIIALILALLLIYCTSVLADESDLVWSTYLGGMNPDAGYGIAVDDSHHVYVVGITKSDNFPVTAGAYDTSYAGIMVFYDAFVVKFNPSGNVLKYSTYLGGDSTEIGMRIVVDAAGSAYISGKTSSEEFPVTHSAFDTTYNGEGDAFIVKLDNTGSDLKYATFLGGSGEEWGVGIDIDNSGNAFITGYTSSTDFPTTAEAFDTTHNGQRDGFVTKLNSAGSELIYSTYLGGGEEDISFDLAIDKRNAYITGYTRSDGFPVTAGAFDTGHNGNYDLFVTKLDSMGSSLVFSTYIGGGDKDIASGIAVDTDGNAFVTGYTESDDFPTTPGAFDTTLEGVRNIFVTKLHSTGDILHFSTFIGTFSEWARGIDVDDYGCAFITGWTASTDFPTTSGAFDTTFGGDRDVFAVKLNPVGSAMDYSTFLGAIDLDSGSDMCLDDSGYVYITGWTWSLYFPTTPEAFDPAPNGSWEAFVSKFDIERYPVSVVLTYFYANSDENCISLDWITASEVNCHSWAIYRSQDENGKYDKIGDLAGHGSTEGSHTYRWVDCQVYPGTTYFYKLKQIDFDGTSWWSHIVSATAGTVVPQSYALHQNYPNPFNPATHVKYQIPKDSHVTLKIFNILGQEVICLVDDDLQAGSYTANWNSLDSRGNEVSTGIYFCAMQAGEFRQTRKMMLLK